LRVDVAIVGGGIAGCAAAVALREAGPDGRGAREGAVRRRCERRQFRRRAPAGRNLAELPLARRARPLWDQLNERLGEDVEFEASGHLKLARSDDEMAQLERHARDVAEHGLRLELLGAAALRAELPWLGPTWSAPRSAPRTATPTRASSARVRAPRAPARRRRARARGGAVGDARRRRVRDPHRRSRGAQPLPRQLRRRRRGRIAAAFGEDVPLQPLVPNMLVTEPLPFFISRSIGVCGGGIYLRQIARGNAILGGGGGWGDAESNRSRPLTGSSLAAMANAIAIVPALAGAHVIRSWTGIDGKMPDLIPVIGWSVTTPNLIHAFGFSGHGFQLGPVVGEIIAELVTQGRSASPLAPFAIDRFADASPSAQPIDAGIEE
jgi:sarcosine oxidase subunit beta